MGSYIFGSESSFSFPVPHTDTNINVADYVLKKLKIGADFGITNCITDCESGESFSCSEVIGYAQGIKLFLLRNGFKPGDTLIYSSHHPSRLHIFLLGVWLANGVVRSSYPEDVVDELFNRLVESQSRWVFCDTEVAPENLSLTSQVPWKVNVIVPGKAEGCISLEDVFLEINRENYTDYSYEASKDDTLYTDIALILPTSGTTGSSKGAVFTHQQLLRNILMLEQMPFVNQIDEPFLLASRMTHATGSTFPLAIICAGRRIILNSKPTLDNLIEAIDKYKVYGVLIFPKFALELAESVGRENINSAALGKLNSLKRVVTAGQGMTDSQVSLIMKRLNLDSFITIYGMTEIGAIATNVSWKSSGSHEIIADIPETSCGKLVPGTQLVIRDIETGIPLGPNAVGEFYIRSTLAFDGYLNNPQAPEKTNVNGWFRTGDLGYIDNNGFIFVTGRMKEIFKYYNNHINPSDLEKVLLKHPFVKEAVVMGVPDPKGGDSIPRAFVVLKQNYESLQDDLANEIRVFFDDQVASYKKLRGGLVILPQMPYGKTGKLLRSALLTCENF